METKPTHQNLDIEATVASGKAWLEKAFRFAFKLRELKRDVLSKYWKFKVSKGEKRPFVKWLDHRHHTKEPINPACWNTGIPTGTLEQPLSS